MQPPQANAGVAGRVFTVLFVVLLVVIVNGVHDFWRFASTAFDATLIARLREVAQTRGFGYRDIVSGGGHDAVPITAKEV